LIGKPGGFFNAQAGAGAHVQANLAGVNVGEEVAAKKEKESCGEETEGQETRGEKRTVVQGGGERAAIGSPKTLEGALKRLLVAAEKTHFLAGVLVDMVLVFRTQQVHRHRRHDGARPHVRSEHGKADGFGERHEEIFGDAGKKEHGDEYDADAQCGNESGNGDLLSAVEDGLDGFFAKRELTIDVFDFDGGIIHEDTDGKSETTEGHDVDGFAEGTQAEQTDKDGKRNGNGDDEGTLPIAKEEKNHNGCETGGDEGLAEDALDGGAHE